MSDKSLTSKAVYNLLSDTSSPEVLAEKIAAYLISNRQTDKLSSILREIANIRLEKEDMLEVELKSARPLSDETKKMVRNLFDEKNVIIHEEQDASLLGGIKVRAHEWQLDTSVRMRLQRLKGGN